MKAASAATPTDGGRLLMQARPGFRRTSRLVSAHRSLSRRAASAHAEVTVASYGATVTRCGGVAALLPQAFTARTVMS